MNEPQSGQIQENYFAKPFNGKRIIYTQSPVSKFTSFLPFLNLKELKLKRSAGKGKGKEQERKGAGYTLVCGLLSAPVAQTDI